MKQSKMLWGLFLGLIGLAITFQSAWAKPNQGLALYGGIASHTMSGTITGGTSIEASSSGLSLGLDYQLPVTEDISINFFLLSSSESYSSTPSAGWSSSGHAIFGVQTRFWIDEYFVGGHLGSYTEVVTDATGSFSSGGNGSGFGITGGWENANGLSITAQYDMATISYSDVEFDMTGIRVHVGWRFL